MVDAVEDIYWRIKLCPNCGEQTTRTSTHESYHLPYCGPVCAEPANRGL